MPVANWITLSRFPLLLLTVLILFLGSPTVRLAGVVVLFIGLMLDTVDGLVARRTGRTSLLGSVLDIATDRTYELVLWVCFADLGLIPTAIPLIVVVRTTVTDALRSIGIAAGTAPFEQQHTTLGRFLVGSAWMRTAYSAGKITTFCGLALANALPDPAATTMIRGLQMVAWLTVIVCVARGLPVVAAIPPGLLREQARSAPGPS
jgi:phosphatidylglycerophosphate synthase